MMRSPRRWTQRYRDGWRACPTIHGRRQYGPRRETEEQAHQDALAMRQRGAIRERHGVVTLGMGIELLRQRTRERGVRPGTIRYLEGNISQIERRFGRESELAAFTPEHIRDWINARIERDGVTPRSAAKNRSVMSQLFSEAMAEGWVERNPVLATGRGRKRERRKRGKAYQWATLMDGLIPQIAREDPVQADLVRLHAHTGLRRAEMARILAGHIEADCVAIDGKTDDRIIPLVGGLRDLFQRVCPVPGDTEQRRIDHIHRAFKRWGKRLGETGFTSHTMRRSFTTELARRRVPRDTIKALLGHRPQSQDVTDLYIVPHDEDMRKALGLLWCGEDWHGDPV